MLFLSGNLAETLMGYFLFHSCLGSCRRRDLCFTSTIYSSTCVGTCLAEEDQTQPRYPSSHRTTPLDTKQHTSRQIASPGLGASNSAKISQHQNQRHQTHKTKSHLLKTQSQILYSRPAARQQGTKEHKPAFQSRNKCHLNVIQHQYQITLPLH